MTTNEQQAKLCRDRHAGIQAQSEHKTRTNREDPELNRIIKDLGMQIIALEAKIAREALDGEKS
jgi:hypothetical protein